MTALFPIVLALATAAVPERLVVVAEAGTAKATVTETDFKRPIRGPQASLDVAMSNGRRSARWHVDGWRLDVERESAANAEFLSLGGRTYLFVHAFSGGAHCCWTLFAFDAATLRPLGRVLDGSSSISLVSQPGCRIGAITVPNDPRHEIQHLGPDLYCFDGRTFRHRRSGVGFPR